MGVEFVGASPEELDRLERFLDAANATPTKDNPTTQSPRIVLAPTRA